MKKLHVFNHWERLQAAMIKDLLAAEGVDCLLRNDQLNAALGEIPFIECRPELWVIDDEIFPRAQALLKAWLKQDADNGACWVCPHCGENCEAQFGACWSCGTLRD